MTKFPSISFQNFKQNKVDYPKFNITSADISSIKMIHVVNTGISIGGYFHAGKRQPAHIFYAELCLSVRLAYQIFWLPQLCEHN